MRSIQRIRSISSVPKKKYDVIVVGGGHNGLTAAAYLAKAGKKVCVLEKRHLLGGAAVTEEIIPGFKFSRASYLLSLLRPVVIEELELKKHGLRYHIRDPSSFTPVRDSNLSLTLGLDMNKNLQEISKFSTLDAQNYVRYEHFINDVSKRLEQLMDIPPIQFNASRGKLLKDLYQLFKIVRPLGLKNAVDFYELMTAPISKVMDKWFESDVLKATLATDGVIGMSASPYDPGTGYVLLHHVMGGLDGQKGLWGYAIGGMGAVSDAIASAARSYKAELFTDKEVSEIIIDSGRAVGVRVSTGEEIHASAVLANTTPDVTFMRLVGEDKLPSEFVKSMKTFNYSSPVTKINVALRNLPSFECAPSGKEALPHHQTTIHMNSETMQIVDQGANDFRQGNWSQRPVIEMTLPTSVDRSLISDPNSGGHVCHLFTQYTPYTLASGAWDQEKKEQYAKHVFSEIDAYASNFSENIIGYEVLTPPDLENIFGLTGGNIFHGAMSLDQLFFSRPLPSHSCYSSPIRDLHLCGSATHPGGGVTGAPGRLAANTLLRS